MDEMRAYIRRMSDETFRRVLDLHASEAREEARREEANHDRRMARMSEYERGE
jgi:hypothetical protein